MARKAIFSVRLNSSERRLVDMAATALDMPPSRMVRELAVKYAVRVLEDAAQDVEAPEDQKDEEVLA